MKKSFIAFLVILCPILLAGCASAGLLTSANLTNVELTKGNFKIVTTSITGQASAQYLLGASIGVGMYTQTFAIIPLTKDRQLYKLAIIDLWKNYETKFGSPIGKKLALVNIRYDSETLNLLVFTKPCVSIVADVVEFTE